METVLGTSSEKSISYHIYFLFIIDFENFGTDCIFHNVITIIILYIPDS